MNNVFGLDIGTRNVVGTVGHRTEDGAFIVEAQYVRQHETRSMLDGQIHDIGKVARTISAVKAELEAQLDAPLSEVCIAAARVRWSSVFHSAFLQESEVPVQRVFW